MHEMSNLLRTNVARRQVSSPTTNPPIFLKNKSFPHHKILLIMFISSSSILSTTQGVNLVNLLHITIVRRILKNIPNFTKQYWKILPKIVLLNPPHNIPFQLRKPLVSPYIVGIHFYQPIFNTPFISYYQIVINRILNAS